MQLPPAVDDFKEGWYEARIVSSKYKKTISGKGAYLSLTFEFQESAGSQAGTVCWVNLNLENANPRTVAIARRQLDQIREAVGQPNAEQSEELHGIPLMVKAVTRKATDKYPEGIDLVAFEGVVENEISFEPEEVKETYKKENVEPEFEEIPDDDIPF